jgi:hypothetical protein
MRRCLRERATDGGGNVIVRAGVLGMAHRLLIGGRDATFQRYELMAQRLVIDQTDATGQQQRQHRQIVL